MEQKPRLGVINKINVQDLPLLLDPYPLQDPKYTRISRFFENLKRGVLSTTKCTGKKCGAMQWPPRVVCPKCDSDQLEWVDLPNTGKVYASSALMLGFPLGMENEGPFCTALVDLDGVALRIFARVDGCAPGELRIGEAVRLKLLELPDGRVWFRFEKT